MKIQKIDLFRYSIPLKHPMVIKGVRQSQRNGVLIKLQDDSGNCGWGDAAPLPGLHRETPEDIINESNKFSGLLKEISFSYDQKISGIIKLLPDCASSLQFALQWAVIDLIAQKQNTSPALLLNPGAADKIKLNALITGGKRASLEQAQHIKTKSYDTVKIKVGSASVEEDIERVLTISDIFENKMLLRFDANQSWSLDEAVKFGSALRDINIDYIEEPLKDPQKCSYFYAETELPFAFDETLQQRETTFFDNNNSGLKALIIKPLVIGSLEKILYWTNFADSHKLQKTFTSSFESDVGLWATAALAAALGTPGSAVGLDTFRWFKNSICKPPFTTENSEIVMLEKKSRLKIETSMLTFVPK